MLVTISWKYLTYDAGSWTADQGIHVPFISHPIRRIASASPLATSTLAMSLKWVLYAPVAPSWMVPPVLGSIGTAIEDAGYAVHRLGIHGSLRVLQVVLSRKSVTTATSRPRQS